MTIPRAAVGNASDRKQVKKAGKKDKLRAQRQAADLRAVMRTAEGRRFVWWLLGECGVLESVMQGGPAMVNYWAGRQDFGHILYKEIILNDPDGYLLMQQEAIQDQKLNDGEPEGDAEVASTVEEEEDGS